MSPAPQSDIPSESPSRIPELGPRGEGWVAVQLLLIAAVAGCGFVGGSWPASVEAFLSILGLVLIAAGATFFLLGILALGSSLTPLPRPRDDGSLRRSGILRHVRHPIYGGVILLALGWSLASSPVGLIPTALLVALLELKSRREEAWLVERYPEYEHLPRTDAAPLPAVASLRLAREACCWLRSATAASCKPLS